MYLIAGQSYACNAHDSLLTVDDPEGRVAVLDPAGNAWRVAHDLQPPVVLAGLEPDDHWKGRPRRKLVGGGRIYAGGSIWPAAMGPLQRVLGVPIGMANAAVGGTAVAEWPPG